MSRLFALAAFGLVAFAMPARADGPRFQFHKGETLTYHVVQTTRVTETVTDEKSDKSVVAECTTKIDLVRKWKVSDVDAKGIATLEVSIASMRWERKSGTEEDVFDSSKPDELNKREMAKHIGPVVAVLRIDPHGNVVEVKESKAGPAARFAADLPFKLILPDATPKTGDAWHRDYAIQLDPPHGTGESYAAEQTYTCHEPESGLLTVALSTRVKALPPVAADQIPLLPLMSGGTVHFHAPTGRYYAARLKTQAELKNHQGERSSYKFASTYVEDLVSEK